jgi:adenosylmethionine-8-amino-7-oxononanoate aminotransferase
MNWNELDRKYVWHPFTQEKTEPHPFVVESAKDATLHLEGGNTLLDCNSSWWVNVHGHGHPEIQQAINEQFSKVDHVIFAGATHHKAIELAQRVATLLPKNLEKVFFSDNGSTAVEVALKMTIQFWHNQGIKKKKILAMRGAYHGDTFGAMSAGERDYFNVPFEDYFFSVDFIDFPDEKNEMAVLEKADEFLSTGEYATLIVEPLIQGSSGMRIYSSFFLDKLVEMARSYETLVIFDEVMTAWGRTGKMFALDHLKQVPDIVCLSKGLTGGVLPLGLTVASQKIYDAFWNDEKHKAMLHGHSFTGNPLACAAACASLTLFEQESTWKNIARICRMNEEFTQEIKGKELPVSVRNLGTILALEIENDQHGYFSSLKEEAYLFFLKNGLLLRPLGNVIFINPPYCLKEEEQEYIFEKIRQFLSLL